MSGPGFHLITFGCQMNVNDSAWLARSLMQQGFKETTLEQADLVFVNTCSVRDKPEQKVHSTLGRVRQVNPRAVVGVAGCVAQQLGASLMSRHPQVRLVAGSDGIVHAPQAFMRLLQEPSLRLSYVDFTESYPDREAFVPNQQIKQASAYVNIMQGCDNFCAYCIVPFTRGPRKSRPTASILTECRQWLDQGAVEITLLGQNVNVFGDDAGGDGTSFPQLLRQVASLPGLRRLRFITPHPRDFSEETIAVMGEESVICPRLHLPLQSGSSTVLERMGRGYNREHYLNLVQQLRRARPDLALSTDIIVGFPGESEEEFKETLDAVQEAGFMSSFSFCYSDRPGTRASVMLDKVDHPIQLERLDRLQVLQNERSEVWLQSRIGMETEVHLEFPSPRQDGSGQLWQGRDAWGDVVHVRIGQYDTQAEGPSCTGTAPWQDEEGAALAGRMVPVRITAAKKHSLLAELA